MNVHSQAMAVAKKAREEIKKQHSAVIWFTGLSGSGKSTIANSLEELLHAKGLHTYLLDGDNLRQGLCRDLGFSDADRVENMRRVSEVARLMADAGLIIIVSFISPFRAERKSARELFDAGDFIEVFVDTPIEVCEARDPKGLYCKARSGDLPNFTGISSVYEMPLAPEIRLDTSKKSPTELASQICCYIERSYGQRGQHGFGFSARTDDICEPLGDK